MRSPAGERIDDELARAQSGKLLSAAPATCGRRHVGPTSRQGSTNSVSCREKARLASVPAGWSEANGSKLPATKESRSQSRTIPLARAEEWPSNCKRGGPRSFRDQPSPTVANRRLPVRSAPAPQYSPRRSPVLQCRSRSTASPKAMARPTGPIPSPPQFRLPSHLSVVRMSLPFPARRTSDCAFASRRDNRENTRPALRVRRQWSIMRFVSANFRQGSRAVVPS